MKALKVTIYGDYATEEGKRLDFSGLEGVLPKVDEDLALQAIRTRYAPMWLSLSDKYPARVKKIRGCFVEEMQEVEHNFSFSGKNIKQMSVEELQDLAVAYQIRRIPLYKKGSLADARMIAYVEYALKVNGKKINDKEEGFAAEFMKLPALIAGDEIRNDRIIAKTNEEVLNEEAKQTSALTLDDLKNILTERGVKFDGRCGYDKLYSLAFPD